MFKGWDKLVYFDTEENQITDEKVQLVAIPKLGPQWKIIHDFKPTKFLEFRWSFWIALEGTSFSSLGVRFLPPNIFLANEDGQLMGSNQVLIVGEWTRLEIIYEAREEGKFFLTFIAGGKLVGRVRVPSTHKGFTNVGIGIGHDTYPQPGFIGRLVVLERH